MKACFTYISVLTCLVLLLKEGYCQQYGTLVLTEICVVDNGEGTNPIWGTKGELHLVIYETDNACYDYTKPTQVECCPPGLKDDLIVPSGAGHGKWNDCEINVYEPEITLWNWRNASDIIKVVVYEKDYGQPLFWWRENDPLFCREVSRKTIESGKFVWESNIHADQDNDVKVDNIKEIKDWIRNNFSEKESVLFMQELKTVYLRLDIIY